MGHPLHVQFAIQSGSRDPREALKIEQDEWSRYTGVVTKANVVRYLANMFWPEAGYDARLDCGLQGGQLILPIYAYPYDPGLNYTLRTSYGILSERAVDEVEFTETISVSLDDEAETRYPVNRMVSMEWLGTVYDEHGNVRSGPGVSVDDCTLSLAAKVYGQLQITYSLVRHAYILTVDARESVSENLFSAVVYAIYTGGLTWLEIEPPPGADEYVDGEADCSFAYGSGTVDSPVDEPRRPKAAYANREAMVDYCSQELMSDQTFGRVEYE